MKKLTLVPFLLVLTGCSTWSTDRVQKIDNKNSLILSTDPKCVQLQESYAKFINDLVNLESKIAGKAALCSINGTKNEVMSEISNDIQMLKSGNKVIIETLKENKNLVSFDSCFQTVSASGFAFQKFGHTAYSYVALIANCSTDGKEAFKNAKSPSDFSERLVKLSEELVNF